MMGMVFSASTTVLADSTVPPIVPTSMRTTAPSKGPSQAVPLLVPVSNLCAVRAESLAEATEGCIWLAVGAVPAGLPAKGRKREKLAG